MIPFRKLAEIVGTLAETAQQAELKQRLGEVHSSLISASESYMEQLEKNIKLVEENTQLKEDVKKYRDWETEKQNYERKKQGHSYFYYRKGAPDDWRDAYCPHCFEWKGREVAIHLQASTKDAHRQIFCPACKNEYRVVH